MRFGADGISIIGPDQGIERWAAAARLACRDVVSDPKMVETWLQCEGTWFVGVDALPNDRFGGIGDVPFPQVLQDHFRGDKHPAQLSIMYPGYPKPRAGESDAAFGYRVRRDAAHVDGILAIGPDRRRFVKEPHAYILGIPVTQCGQGASPMVIWRGSHHIMRAAFRDAFDGCDPADWSNIDVTEAYTAARNKVFETCDRDIVHVDVGCAYAIHPLMLHGVSAWEQGADAPEDGRIIAYFRPQLTSVVDWINCPD